MHILSAIHIYPVKSLGGISLTESLVQPRGLRYDRRWMLIDETGRFVSQRELAALTGLGTALEPPFLIVFSKKDPAQRVRIPLEPELAQMPELAVQIWDDRCPARLHDPQINDWFSKLFDRDLRLVYMPDATYRRADAKYAPEPVPVSFADGFPFLVIGQASVDDLNRRLAEPLPMNRFRPNFVFTGGMPYEEETWADFRIGAARFRGVKPCGRCSIITTDQDSGERGAEPLQTLAAYRKQGNRILFGQNAVWLGEGSDRIRIGDEIKLGE